MVTGVPINHKMKKYRIQTQLRFKIAIFVVNKPALLIKLKERGSWANLVEWEWSKPLCNPGDN